MRVIIGLGNPGIRYRFTRHNIGFILLDFIAQKNSIPFRVGEGDYYYAETTLADRPVVLVKPTTYMNNSGLAAAQIAEGYEIGSSAMLIVYDDFHLPFGTLRFRGKGSAGGHNGIKSLIEYFQTEIFDRLRIGIGSTDDNPIDFVLSKFTEEEQKLLEPLMNLAYAGILSWLESGIGKAMNDYNRNMNHAPRNT